MLDLIRDLYSHQAWADSEMWRFLAGSPAAQSDPRVIELLNHIHTVQRFFLSVIQGSPVTRDELTKGLPLAELRESYQRYHANANPYLATMAESRLNETVIVPWFPNFQPKCSEALVQAATHSIHHRAQIAMLIRQHGGDPKPTDYIVWAAKNRPAPQWSTGAAA
jgi:uncharacterized damage-inducible protein DinB